MSEVQFQIRGRNVSREELREHLASTEYLRADTCGGCTQRTLQQYLHEDTVFGRLCPACWAATQMQRIAATPPDRMGPVERAEEIARIVLQAAEEMGPVMVARKGT